MLTKTITYTDYNGTERTEKFYFNLNQVEMLDLELSAPEGMSSVIEKMTENNDVGGIVGLVKQFVAKSYGVKSDDGKRFIKNEGVLEEFMQSEAYPVLLMELVTDVEKSTAFFNGLVNADTKAMAANKPPMTIPVK